MAKGWKQSDDRYASIPGFSEKEPGRGQVPAGAGGQSLTRGQRALRAVLIDASASKAPVDRREFSVADGLEVALDSLRRSNAIVEEILSKSMRSRRQFERRSTRIDAQLVETGRKIADLVGHGR